MLTHGEPHPGNALLTREGWRLVDWDTALTAPPERDLWHLAAAGPATGGGSILGDYAAATGITPRPERIELYRLRWDLADLAASASRFFQPHGHGPDDSKTWELLQSVRAVPRRPGRPGGNRRAAPAAPGHGRVLSAHSGG